MPRRPTAIKHDGGNQAPMAAAALTSLSDEIGGARGAPPSAEFILGAASTRRISPAHTVTSGDARRISTSGALLLTASTLEMATAHPPRIRRADAAS